jgi:hypothetical protein
MTKVYNIIIKYIDDYVKKTFKLNYLLLKCKYIHWKNNKFKNLYIIWYNLYWL